MDDQRIRLEKAETRQVFGRETSRVSPSHRSRRRVARASLAQGRCRAATVRPPLPTPRGARSSRRWGVHPTSTRIAWKSDGRDRVRRVRRQTDANAALVNARGFRADASLADASLRVGVTEANQLVEHMRRHRHLTQERHGDQRIADVADEPRARGASARDAESGRLDDSVAARDRNCGEAPSVPSPNH